MRSSTNAHAVVGSPSARSAHQDGSSRRESFAVTLWARKPNPEKDKFNRKRLMQLFAGILIACCGGSSFAFGIFSNKIKESAHLSQSDMTTITTAGFIFQGFTIPAGILYDYYGPQSVLGCAVLLSCGGFALLAMIFDGVVPSNVYAVSVANAMANMGAGFTDSGSLMTNLFNFPVSSGEVLIIQKTFFGLGATFLSLIFDGFFSSSENYIGYAVFVCVMMFGAIGFGTLVTRLPPYKRTIRDQKRIEELADPEEREAERLAEQKSFTDFHNPRLVDQRRLNLGVTILLVTLIFFSSFSIASTYIEFSQNVLTGLTVLACMCLFSFTLLILPIRIPSFFDYEFLPDIHAPESLVDKPEDEGRERPHPENAESLLGGPEGARVGMEAERDCEDAAKCKRHDESIVSASKAIGFTYSSNNNSTAEEDTSCDGTAYGGATRASSCARQNGPPISLPRALAASSIPSIEDSFVTNLKRPMLWCFFFTAFSMTGANAVLLSNFTQILIAANDGVYDAKSNSLCVALAGIGSALGRILVGYTDIYLHRRNALLRESQLRWEASQDVEQGGNPPSASTSSSIRPADMNPVHHRLTSSPAICIPLSPAIACLCLVTFTFVPASVYPPVLCLFGVGVGSYFGLAALTVKEIFSAEVGKHYNFILAAGMLSAVLLNRLMFGEWYDSESEGHRAEDGVSCEGYECFTKSLYVLASLCALAVGSSSYIAYYWWQVRKQF